MSDVQTAPTPITMDEKWNASKSTLTHLNRNQTRSSVYFAYGLSLLLGGLLVGRMFASRECPARQQGYITKGFEAAERSA